MKRHDALVPLSKEHHHTLILARLLRKDAPPYKGLPSTASEKIAFALTAYHSRILPHFKKEEAMFKKLKGLNKEIDGLISELDVEHRQIESCFNALNASLPDTDLMNDTGVALDNHIRKEERVLFPLIQETCKEEMLDQIRLLL